VSALAATCFMSCPVTAVIWEPNMEARVTCDARDRPETPDRADRALARENTDPAADARLAVPSRTVLRSNLAAEGQMTKVHRVLDIFNYLDAAISTVRRPFALTMACSKPSRL